jgi:hypothetical protein
MTHPLLQALNQGYLAVHREKEQAFWREKMALAASIPGDFTPKEIAWQAFCAEPAYLPRLREALLDASLSDNDRQGLMGWQRFFTAHTIESGEARALQTRIVGLESDLARARGSMALGYRDPHSGEFTPASSIKLGLLLRTSPDAALRQAAYRGLQSIETAMLSQGFLEIVKARNALGRMLGYEDYYDFKVSRNEGFSKKRLFEVLNDLVKQTSHAGTAAVAEAERRHGPMAREGYNLPYLMSGDLTAKLDPYFAFGDALLRWGKSFTALGIRYRGATLTLDLLDRKGKYENGFMHGPTPAWMDAGKWQPASINFTANAIPGQVGSGHRATETLFHEGGHAAHFSNILMPAPCFSQEYAPTSVALAETQSMFLDSFIDSPDWIARYARDAQGTPMPAALVRENIATHQPWKAFQVRSMLTVCYAEKAIYEIPDRDLNADHVLRTLRGIEQEMQGLREGVRPVLSIPHLLSGESSAYYHGYILAEMAVHQTRRYFQKRDGVLADNPAVGRDLAATYWAPGNSRTFFDLVQDLTGTPFSADAIVEEATRPVDAAMAEAEKDLIKATKTPGYSGPVELDAHIAVIHGDEAIAANDGPGGFEAMAAKFAAWLQKPEART